MKPQISPRSFRRLLLIGIVFASLTGCPDIYLDDDSEYTYKPVYLSYDELRRSVAVQSPRAISRVGRVYLYGNYFFLNERNLGIHIFNNTDPTAPVNAAFIRIPGNTELSIKDGFLYADSYVDLVTLDLNNPDNIQVSARTEDVFPWDAYQAVGDDIYFSYDQLDRTRGVITGYE